MDSSVYANKEFIQASKRWVNVYCSKDSEHGSEKVDGKEMCKLHPNITCDEHKALDGAAGGKGYFTGTFRAPATVWAMPDGKEIGKQQGPMSAKQLIEKMAEAEKAVGPGLGSDEYEFLLDKLAAGEKATKDAKIHDAVEAYAAAIKAMAKTPGAKTYVDKAQAALDKLVESGKNRLEDAVAAKDAKDFAKAKEALKSLQADFKGQPFAKEVDKALADVAAAEKEAGKK